MEKSKYRNHGKPNPIGFVVAVLIGVACIVFSLNVLSPVRVGDGTEYYGLYFAWIRDHRPFMMNQAWEGLQELWQSRSIEGLVPPSVLENHFPELHLGNTSDFNHFWMYSLLAAVVGKITTILGLPTGPHASFIFLHAVLISGTIALAFYINGWRGLVAFVLMSALSPMIWYVDKVHTELFTYCLCTSAIIALCGRRYFFSSLLLALASTQNISFAAIALVPLIFAVIEPESRRRFSLIQVISASITLLLVLLHPGYYFFRFGAIDPQFVAGGAAVGANLKAAYVWLLDPDIGLFPNWPLGIALVAVVFVLILRRSAATKTFLSASSAVCPIRGRFYVGFLLWYLLINLYAQSSTTNINSGATPGIARYATWYIPLFYPLSLVVIDAALAVRYSRAKSAIAWIGLVLVGILCGVFTVTMQRPELTEVGYTIPSPLSWFIQTKAPLLYNPPSEIYLKRYSGIGESPALATALGIVGPDCKKVYINTGSDGIFSRGDCGYDQERLGTVLRQIRGEAKTGFYVQLSEEQRHNSLAVCPPRLDLATGGNRTSVGLTGISGSEPWGAWSDGKTATLTCLPEKAQALRIAAKSFSPQGHIQHMLVSVVGVPPLLFAFDGTEKTVDVPLPPPTGKPLRIKFEFPDAISPRSIGMNADSRELSVGFETLTFE